MIKYFGTQYAGHVLEGENIGFDGTPINDRWYPNERLVDAFETCKRGCQLTEALGFDVFWMAEHHFQREGTECLPNLMMLSLWLAQHTERIKFGCLSNIIPMWHPLRLAEDFAMVDIFTHGRVIFGVGRGYHTREVETFGAPMLDGDANRELFEEQVEVVLKAFDEESFSHKGKHCTIPPDVPYRGYQLKEITLVPRPTHRPVEIWQPMSSGSPRGMEFMSKHGMKGIIAGSGLAHVDEWMHQFQEANARYGRQLELGENIALGMWCWLGDSRDSAKLGLRPIWEEHVKFAAPLGMLRYTDEQLKELGPTAAATHVASGADYEETLESGTLFCDTPEHMVELLKGIEEKYPGLEHFIMMYPIGETRDQFKEQVTRFAQEMMRAFRNTKVV